MPLKKLILKAGVNQENTRYTNENGWYESQWARFRQGTPEKIGGWARISANYFLGVCRSLWNWVTLSSQNLIAVGTEKKFYISQGGAYYDATPIRATSTLTNPFSTILDSSAILVTDAAGGYVTGDYVTFVGSTAVGGITLLGEYRITPQSSSTYNVTAESPVLLNMSTGVFVSQFKLANGVKVVLSTTGQLPTGFVAGTTYYVVSTSGYSFNLAATSGGAAIIPSGSQSGVHTATAKANASTSLAGGTVYAMYQINIGSEVAIPIVGWGAGPWGGGAWGIGQATTINLRLWSQSNFGEDLVYGYRNGPMYYWNASFGVSGSVFTVTIASPAVLTFGYAQANNTAVQLTTSGALPTGLIPGTTYYVVNASGNTCNLSATPGGSAITTTGTQSGEHYVMTRGIPLTSLAGASDVPTLQNLCFVSDVSRFTFAFGATDYSSAVQDPMLIRWSDQESLSNWTPSATTQAGSLRLSHGSEIVTCLQTRQEIVVFTDSSVYSLQYLGPPVIWGAQILGDNISILGQNCVAVASGVIYWMGVDKFYKYDGRVQTLRCDLRQYIYNDINLQQGSQVFASTSEGFNEVWFFYCSLTGPDGTGTTTNPNTVVDRYVVYNYFENNGEGVWYYGNLQRTAWLDSGLSEYPIAATYDQNLVYHEFGTDDNTTGTPAAIYSKISSSEFDIDDGDKFGFVWRMLPDITFRGSTAEAPTGTMTLIPMQNSGSGYNNPISLGGNPDATVTRTSKVPIEQFTGQVYVRVRGRQMILQFENEQLGSQWQLGAPRIDIRHDGRRGNS
jgi:hypothetical protein